LALATVAAASDIKVKSHHLQQVSDFEIEPAVEPEKPATIEEPEMMEPEPEPEEDYIGESAEADAEDAIWCDPYGGCREPEPWYKQIDYNYDKNDVHAIVWPSLIQVAAPTVAFILFEEKAWEDYQTKNAKFKGFYKREDRYHYTDEIKAWELVMMTSAAVWGPMFLMGIFALSDMFRVPASRYIEHGLSNLMVPAAAYSGYLLLSVAVDSGWVSEYLKFAGAMATFVLTIGEQRLYGTRAMYYLIDGLSPHADEYLTPSIFYLLNWSEHTERQWFSKYGGYDY